MPSLSVNEVLLDPDLADTFEVHRRNAVVGGNGRSSVALENIPDVVGVVTWTPASRLERRDDGQLADASIDIVTPFALRGASFGFQPDVVVWRGSRYLVTFAQPFRQFGEGFTKATATSTRATDNPP